MKTAVIMLGAAVLIAGVGYFAFIQYSGDDVAAPEPAAEAVSDEDEDLLDKAVDAVTEEAAKIEDAAEDAFNDLKDQVQEDAKEAKDAVKSIFD